MRNKIKEILRESDFEWLDDVPEYIQIIEPVTVDNPKDVFRLHWINEFGDVNADNWYDFDNTPSKLELLIRYLKMLDIAVIDGEVDFGELVNTYFEDGEDYIVQDWMTPRFDPLPDVNDEYYNDTLDSNRDALYDMLREDFFDMGLINYSENLNDDSRITKYWVTYFDEHGVEYKTQININ